MKSIGTNFSASGFRRIQLFNYKTECYNPQKLHNSSLAINSATKINEQSPIQYLSCFCSYKHPSCLCSYRHPSKLSNPPITHNLLYLKTEKETLTKILCTQLFLQECTYVTNLTSSSNPKFSSWLYELNEKCSSIHFLYCYAPANAFDNWNNKTGHYNHDQLPYSYKVIHAVCSMHSKQETTLPKISYSA